MIVVTPSWYGFGWRICDESGTTVGESQEDVYLPEYAQENARREVDRLITKRVMGKASPHSVSGSTASKRPSMRSSAPQRGKPVAPAQTERSATPASSQEIPFPAKQPSQEVQFPALPSPTPKPVDAPAPADRNAMPATLLRHQAPGLAGRIQNVYTSMSTRFEDSVDRRHSPHTRRAYREDIIAFDEFMMIDWPQDSAETFAIKISAAP